MILRSQRMLFSRKLLKHKHSTIVLRGNHIEPILLAVKASQKFQIKHLINFCDVYDALQCFAFGIGDASNFTSPKHRNTS